MRADGGPARPTLTDNRESAADPRLLAARIRAERVARGWTLRDLGAKVDVSIARLSAIENGRQALDVDLVVAIARALEIGIGRLVPHAGAPAFCVSRQNDGLHLPMRLVNDTNETFTTYHNRLKPLAANFVGKYIEPFDIEVWPVSDAEMKFISHHHEEFLLVLSGTLECLIKTPRRLQREVLSAGDCIHFWSYLPHCLRSLGCAPARSIHVLCSLDEPADSEVSDSRTGPVFLADGTQRGFSASVGARLQGLRRRRGMGLGEFARQAGLSPRKLAALERGTRRIPIELLLEICQRFGRPLEYFLESTLDVPPYFEIHRGAELRQATARSGATRRWSCLGGSPAVPLTRHLPGHRMSPALLRVDAPCRGALSRHPGQEFLYVLNGSLRVTIHPGEREAKLVLSPGDSCFIDASIPHAFEPNQVTPFAPGETEVLAVSWRPAGNGHRRA